MHHNLRLFFGSALLFFSATALALECEPSLTMPDVANPTTPLNNIITQIKSTIRDPSPTSYGNLAKHLREFKKTAQASLWVTEDDQEGRYHYFIDFAHTLAKKTSYIHLLERVDALTMALSKIEDTLTLLKSLHYFTAEDKARSLEIVIHRIDHFIDDYDQTLAYFYKIKDYETKYFNAEIANDAINYTRFSVFDWNFILVKINSIPAYLTSGKHQLEELKAKLQRDCIVAASLNQT